MLPSGVLAKHGYTTKWGFFSGVCTGSGYLPFEQSTDRIATAIAAVKQTIKSVNAEVTSYEDLANPVNDGSKVWVNLYVENEGYQWNRARLHDLSTHNNYGAPHSSCKFTTLDPVWDRRSRESKVRTADVSAYDEHWKMHTLPEWARFLNRKYAATLVKQNVSRQSWLKWQAERVATWAPKPLTPR